MSYKPRALLASARWPEYFHLKYCLYIILYFQWQNHADPSLNRRGKFFKGLARWLGNRKTAQQCRTHHNKQLQRFGQNIEQMRKAFLEDLYFIRRLEISHLLTEVQHHLHWLAEEKILSLAEEEEAKNKAREIIAEYESQVLPVQSKAARQDQPALLRSEGCEQGEKGRT